jgi:hypothetical protein
MATSLFPSPATGFMRKNTTRERARSASTSRCVASTLARAALTSSGRTRACVCALNASRSTRSLLSVALVPPGAGAPQERTHTAASRHITQKIGRAWRRRPAASKAMRPFSISSAAGSWLHPPAVVKPIAGGTRNWHATQCKVWSQLSAALMAALHATYEQLDSSLSQSQALTHPAARSETTDRESKDAHSMRANFFAGDGVTCTALGLLRAHRIELILLNARAFKVQGAPTRNCGGRETGGERRGSGPLSSRWQL